MEKWISAKISSVKNHFNGFRSVKRRNLCLCIKQNLYFGPTFRAENSNTTRHLAEFWMVEPEVAFATLADNAKLAEDMLKYVFRAVLAERKDDLQFFENM